MGNDYSRPEPPATVSPTPDLSEQPAPSPPARVTARVEVDADLIGQICNTRDFDSDELLVVRRGEQFPITVHAATRLRIATVRLLDANSNGNSLQLAFEVDATRTTRTGTELRLSVPADAPVGEYVLQVEGGAEDGGEFNASLRRKVVVLFNAWSRNDAVYLEESAYRDEYVLNTRGRVYAGSLYGIPWSLGLYREETLPAVLLLLRRASLSFEQRRSVVLVSREMSAMVNVQGDNGVLVGNWSGEYEDGTAPSAWRGSAKILQQYLQSNGQPVRYGQCWVFSGVLLSVLRVLGIPSRSVTNFGSAHDANRNRTIDEYYSEEGDKIPYLSSGSDSVWNFHVWNEAWMSRSDLPAGFGGWQALDATPQEESPQGGGYRTGPAPVKAVKEGNSVVYDANFVIAEVNADIKRYVVGSDGAPRLVSVNTSAVGKTISTKSVGSSRREDLTNAYKHPEGTDWERRALYFGYEELLKETHDMTFSIAPATYSFGQDVMLSIAMSNKARQHVVKGTVLCEAVDYTGKILKEVEKKRVETKVNKGKTETVSMTIAGSIFSEYPRNKVYLRFTVFLAVQGSSQVFSEVVPVAPDPPELKITAPEKMVLGGKSRAIIQFKNPLPVKMEKIVLTVEGDGLLSEDIEHVVGTIDPGAMFSFTFDLLGLVAGTQQLVAGLDSEQVELVGGEREVVVYEGEEETETPPTPPEEVSVVSVDTNLDTNRRVHHTAQFREPGLVLRRGQLFSLSLKLATPISPTNLVTRATFTLLGYSNPYSFEIVAVSTATGDQLMVELTTPSDVPVGRYKIILTVASGEKVSVIDQRLTAVLLFNPWNSQDTCYYPDTSELKEYVLSNQGRIWVGSANSNYGRPWQFAQFTPQALEVILYLLSRMKQKDRADPVKVTRHISAMVNTQDDNGVLVGNWTGDYSGGESPLSWTGSAEILAQYKETKRPVKYGQCWVFSGVQTSLLRCVGLPARSVTNFNSAHDTHFNRAIDRYFNEEGDEIENGDSIWNFHVWNEAWMSRSDLPAGFGGWQALDATPQEESPQGGGFRLGPCPVRAVKLGQRVNYDVEFVISEVNADIRYYVMKADGTKSLTKVHTTHVGKNISTKAVGSSVVNIITDSYKFLEGSTSERAAMRASSETAARVGLAITTSDDVIIGQSFTVVATVTNKTSEDHVYGVRVRGRAMLYTGITGQVVKSVTERVHVTANQSADVEVKIHSVDYLKLLEGGNYIHFIATVIAGDEHAAVETYNLRLKTPDIKITLPAEGLRLYQPATIKVSFQNPLDHVLKRGRFLLLGESHLQAVTVDMGTISPRAIVNATLTTIPVVEGPVEVVVKFSSDKLSDLMGDVETIITA